MPANLDFFFLNLNQALVQFLLCVYTQQNKVEIEDRSFQSLDYSSIQTMCSELGISFSCRKYEGKHARKQFPLKLTMKCPTFEQ